MSQQLLNAALAAAERGWHVIPLAVGQKFPALHGEKSCTGRGDCASGHRKWEQRATIDPQRIERCWAAGGFNVGIATGPSGLVVVDLDLPKPKDSADTPSGVTTFKALCERAGQAVPTTYRVRTASGGQHLYFTAPDDHRLPSTKDKLGLKIDTRAWGGQVVAPGSTTPSGAYEVIDSAPVIPLPAWLLDALKPAAKPSNPPAIAPARNATRVAQVALDRECAKVAAALEGKREAVLFKSARSMGRFVAWGDIPRHEVEQAFQAAAESAGLKSYECRSTLRSALNWSIRNARPRDAA
ncbi:bifunctional DNA primase/polymerase [Streptomyces lunaelactis]|uniref:bifunctional DNA primase/polymerase n=1 Tax=Streptomyces lunaelactis TaxID=1535768 RepID=UPI001585A571|nr:bifunctional DNA primase/polymerase [Streptomyces lunaelactis]NUK08625.1 bifunctional DNA primase/polymerase [Streptomyces lunaelactis]NUL12830.1 bifunctional DNA primase/polymerase [Streptomyces lunaelactis]NUL25951.1 bifunctional DNA primase/polymerase [Streptomyces lunaelactis]